MTRRSGTPEVNKFHLHLWKGRWTLEKRKNEKKLMKKSRSSLMNRSKAPEKNEKKALRKEGRSRRRIGPVKSGFTSDDRSWPYDGYLCCISSIWDTTAKICWALRLKRKGPRYHVVQEVGFRPASFAQAGHPASTGGHQRLRSHQFPRLVRSGQ